ncbi:TOTE conflict system archaeo-eukaryotic primase domain-containing protein [Sutcliffiella horikoshii]|uniref:TOTE conflict system archaeo-eukaryotic primase domain-containing protein n=1 Tax=Sutcliffiella horikoshii TaxID=79883 RepID=UPI00384D0E94
MVNRDKEIIEKINELFIMVRYQYLIQSSDGSYLTLNKHKNEKVYPLTDYVIQRHLDKKTTVGIFSSKDHTKFLCFDVDVKEKQQAKWTVYRLVNGLIEIGIPEEEIHISLSGNKGYHVELYFNHPIKNELAHELYLLTLNKSELLNIDYGEVEYRPNGMQQGVKLPLGINFKNKSKPRCWYVDYDKGLKPICNMGYILKIKQMDVGIIYNILEREQDCFEEKEVKAVEEARGFVEAKHKPLKIYKENIDEQETIEAIENLIDTGLTKIGTRHNSLFKLARYYRHFGYTQDECKESLLDWMGEQDTRKYTTKWDDCIKDIYLIVKYVYENEVSITIVGKDLFITYEEMQQLLKMKSKNEKLLAYCLLIHSKRYALGDGRFYMTFKQMSEASGLCEKTTRTLTNKLEQSGILYIVERNRQVKNEQGKVIKKEKKPNIYKMNIRCENEDKKPYNVVYNDINYAESFRDCIHYLFDTTELKRMLPRRQFERLAS